MAAEDKKEGSSLKKQIMAIISSNISPILKAGFQGIVKKVQDVIYHTQKRVMENFLMVLLLFAGFVFISVSAVFFINSYFELDAYWGFLIMGLLLVMTAFIFRWHIKKTRYFRLD